MNTYLFDFDGTLVDSMPTFAGMMKRILDENNISYGDDLIKIIAPLGYKGTAIYFKEKLGIKLSLEEIGARMDKYVVWEYTHNVPAKNNVVKTLQALKSRGAVLNILTASPHFMIDPCLERLGIYGLFDNVWSCEDFKTTKADPRIYTMVAEKIGVPVGEVLFLDDNFNADKTAKDAGMKVCGVYDESSADCEDEIRAVTDYYIKDFSELLDI